MNTQVLITIISQVVSNLPAYIKTARELMHLINDAYERVQQAIGGGEATDEELKALVEQIVANSARINAIDPEPVAEVPSPPPTDPT